jgi:cytochrome c oxidase subunit 2
MFVWAANLYFDISTPPTDTLEVSVIAQQWMWKFQHADGQREINELHVPANRPVKLLMTSQDVIHSFFVPAFRVKQDVLPGRYTTLWFEATKTGEYHLLCAEYCGTDHASMTGTIIVMDPAQYQNWLSQNQAGETLASAGEQLFLQLGCESCHRRDDSGRGPSLVGVYGSSVTLANGQTVTADENYIRESILQPQAKIVAGYEPIMPTFEGQVSEADLVQLISYIRSLGEGQAGQGQSQPEEQGEPGGGQEEPDQNGEN